MSPTPHSASSTSDGLDHVGELNHSGPVMPRWPRIAFTGPVPGLNRYTNASVAATGGASAGREKIVRYTPGTRLIFVSRGPLEIDAKERAGTLMTTRQTGF